MQLACQHAGADKPRKRAQVDNLRQSVTHSASLGPFEHRHKLKRPLPGRESGQNVRHGVRLGHRIYHVPYPAVTFYPVAPSLHD